MDNKGILHGMGGWSQFFFFFFLFSSGMIFCMFVLGLFMTADQMTTSAPSLRWAQTIQAVFMFLIPPLVFAFLYSGKPEVYLKADSEADVKLLFWAVLLIIFIQPVINCIGYYNQQVVLPESFNWMKEFEESAERSLNVLFANKSIASLVFNLLVIAVVAGLAEEVFFRGCLQQIMQQIVKNKHVAIWITAIIFSAVHFQFYGFVPRVLLGALLGYLFVWSGSIWVPVIVHTVHNAINVVLIHIYHGTPEAPEIEDFAFGDNMWLILVGLVLSVLVLFLTYRNRIIRQESEN